MSDKYLPRLGFLGPMGSHSSAAAAAFAASTFWDGKAYSPVLCASLAEVLLSIGNGTLDLGIVPVENALEGSVTEVVEGLHQSNLTLLAEFTRPIVHGLLIRPGTQLQDIKILVSHPQALGQCRQRVHQTLGHGVTILPAASTAQAAEQVRQGLADAALGAHPVARALGLDIRIEQMSDNPDNQTRFLLVGADAARYPQALGLPLNKTAGLPIKSSIRVDFGDIGDYPGALVDVLLVFKRANLNLTKIESRPSRLGLGRYQFYMDVAADVTTPPHCQLIADLNRYFCHQVHTLGPYYQLGLL